MEGEGRRRGIFGEGNSPPVEGWREAPGWLLRWSLCFLRFTYYEFVEAECDHPALAGTSC